LVNFPGIQRYRKGRTKQGAADLTVRWPKRRKVMKKQIKNIVGLALLLVTASAFAQITHTIGVQVPFSFVADGRNWPAGEYRIKIDKHMGLLTLSSEGVTPATFLTNKDERRGDPSSRTYLQFQHYGDRWVLQAVTLDGTAQILNSGKLEKELARLKPSGNKTLVAQTVAVP
jgi:hypothetical protein